MNDPPARKAVVMTLVVCLAACAQVPAKRAADPLADVPAAWSDGSGQPRSGMTPLAQWWLRFHDPLLAALVTSALQSNTSIDGARAALRQARALRDVSAAGLFPQLGGSASAQRGKTGRNAAMNQFGVGMDASWELDVFGANRSAMDAGEATMRASEASLADIQVSSAAEVALNYIALRGTQARLAIARDNLDSQLDTLQITQWRRQAGLVSSLEVEQARGAAEQTRGQLPLLRTNIEQFRHALSVLTGQPPAALTGMLQVTGPVPTADETLALSIPADTLRQRPDVRAAQWQLTAAVARVSQARAQRLPNFKLGGSLGLNALTLGALGGGGALVTSLLAGVSVPLLDGGAGKAQVQSQQAALDQSGAAYRATVLGALKDVEDALAALQGDRDRLAALQLAAQAAGNAAAMARQRYGSGLVDFQTVLETQRTLLGTQDAVALLHADIGADHVRLYKALGGGWEPEA